MHKKIWQKTPQEIFWQFADAEEKFAIGLSNQQAETNLHKFGHNRLPQKKRSLLKLFFSQFNDFLIGILIIALIISLVLPFIEHDGSPALLDFLDGMVIGMVLMLNALFGFWQEYKVEKEIETLSKLSNPKTKVMRDGKIIIIDSSLLVPGDIILIEEGDQISADARILESIDIRTNESLLTGESLPVEKINTSIKTEKLAIADRHNLLFAGTQVVKGHGRAVIFATALETEIGKIAKIVSESVQTITPLQQKMQKLSLMLGKITIVICTLIFLSGVIFDKDLYEIFLTAIALAVSVVPEGLPAVITISLAIGAKQMLKHNVLTRKLAAIETLGAINTICSDKTGTITQNIMTVKKIFCNHKIYDQKEIDHLKNPQEISKAMDISTNCNSIITNKIGDPTEIALYNFAIDHQAQQFSKIDEIPFSSEAKNMATLHKITEDHQEIFKKGAIEKIINQCTQVLINNKIEKLNKKEKDIIIKNANELANQGFRIIALSYKKTVADKIAEKESNFIFVGFACLHDPPRPKAAVSILEAIKAGIKTKMITGDNLITAQSIAKEVGIQGKAMSGQELDEVTDQELQKIVKEYAIFARVNPEHKLRILQALQQNGEIVAMTGDGVNDAPALKNADVGIGMGKNGTDTARAASDIVLVSDDFSDIPRGIFIGRTIDDNIKKFVIFLLSCNFKEIILIVIAIIFSLPIPFLPIHILWLNLITDSFPAMALALDPPKSDIKTRAPKHKDESLFKGKITFMISATLIGASIILLIFGQFSDWFTNFSETTLDKARTAVLFQAIILEMMFIFSVRTDHFALNKSLFSNKYLLASIGLVAFLQILLMFTPLAIIFRITPLSSTEFGMMFGLAFIGFLLLEFIKIFERKLIKILNFSK